MTRFYQDVIVSVLWIVAIGVVAGMTLDITRRTLRTEEALIDEAHPEDRDTFAVDLITVHVPGEEGIIVRVTTPGVFTTNDAEAIRRFGAMCAAAADAIDAFEPPGGGQLE